MAETNPVPTYPPDSVFKVYNIVSGSNGGSGSAAPLSPLLQGIQEDEYFYIENYQDHSAQGTVQHHLESVRPGDRYYLQYFIIIDRFDIANQGVMVLNTDYNGYIDAVRREADSVNDIVRSLSITNTDWWEERGDTTQNESHLVPINRFALYNLLPTEQQQSSFEEALFLMNDGLGILDLSDSTSSGGTINDSDSPREAQRDYYQAAESDGKTIDQLVNDHYQYANTHQLDPGMFAVVDPDWKDQGILIYNLMQQGRFDSFRRKGPTAGEMLNWVFVGLMTWEEAKNFGS